jgi:hypothetical protein
LGWQRHRGKLLFIGVKLRREAHESISKSWLESTIPFRFWKWMKTNSVCYDFIPNRGAQAGYGIYTGPQLGTAWGRVAQGSADTDDQRLRSVARPG